MSILMDNARKEKIAQLVKAGRLRKGYSQQQLADLAQLNLRSVQRIENGEVLPRAFNLNLLAKQLELEDEILVLNAGIVTESAGTSLTTGTAQPEKRLSRARKMILSISLILLSILLTAAFLSQSQSFPETSFEFFLCMGAVVTIDAVLLWHLWR